jgi:pimeloyl-ACP methyl ester carboxylesterase
MGGSPVACLAPRFFKRWIPALNDLSSGPEGIHHRLQDELALPTLVIAARYDILVPLAATSLRSEHERVQFAGTHNSLLIDPRVFLAIHRFLRESSTNA